MSGLKIDRDIYPTCSLDPSFKPQASSLTVGEGYYRIDLERIWIVMKKKKIISWSIDVKWSDGSQENLIDFDDTTAVCVDDYLTEIENEENENRKDIK